MMDERSVSRVLFNPKEKYSVKPIDPKYADVKGSLGVDIRCCKYAQGPIRAAHDAKNRIEPTVQSIANFRGLSDRTGNRKKQITKQDRAPRLQAPNTNNLSHRLNANQPSSSSLLVGAGN